MMNLEQFFCDYADHFTVSDATDADQCVLLSGFAAMYVKTKNQTYFDIVKGYVDDRLQKLSSDSYQIAGLVKFMYEQTKEEVYKSAMGQMAANLSSLAKDENGLLIKKDGSSYSAQDLYFIYPFLTWYDTNFNKKENYLTIMSQLRYITSHQLDDSKTSIRDKEFLMMMLAETVDGMSEEIYEHYALLKSWLKKAVHSNIADVPSDNAMMAYVLFRGSLNKSLLAEKYLPVAYDKFECAKQMIHSGDYDQTLNVEAGALMMAYALITIE